MAWESNGEADRVDSMTWRLGSHSCGRSWQQVPEITAGMQAGVNFLWNL